MQEGQLASAVGEKEIAVFSNQHVTNLMNTKLYHSNSVQVNAIYMLWYIRQVTTKLMLDQSKVSSSDSIPPASPLNESKELEPKSNIDVGL